MASAARIVERRWATQTVVRSVISRSMASCDGRGAPRRGAAAGARARVCRGRARRRTGARPGEGRAPVRTTGAPN
eukprot:1787381-Prymnesium_polylepis.1